MAGEINARNLVKFDGKNFQHWKFQLTAALIANDLLDIVIGVSHMPEDADGVEGKAWIKDNAKAMFLLSSSIEAEQMQSLFICRTVKEMWDRLTAHS